METRSALIVATDTYSDAGLTMLRAPGADAAALAEVLGDPGIGGFDVQSVVNQQAHEITRSIAQFFANRRPGDLLLLHLSCHGVKDDSGELYFAASDTALDLLEATAVSSTFVNRVMERSRAGRVLLLLDCCYSGAFARGLSSRAGGTVDVNERLGGKGRAVITASSALQFAFEGQRLTDGDVEASEPSVFTSALVTGLRTGDADRDRDGWVSLDELYGYVHDEVTKVTPDQTPKKWTFDVQGDLYVARRGGPVSEPSALPPEIAEAMTSLVPWNRLGVVEPLTALLTGTHPGLALGARLALEEMAAVDDSDRVKQAARAALASGPAVAPLPPLPEPPTTPAPTTPVAAQAPPVEPPPHAPPAATDPPPPSTPATPPGSDGPSVEPSVEPGVEPGVEPRAGTGRRGPRGLLLATGAVALVVVAGLGWWLLGDHEGADSTSGGPSDGRQADEQAVLPEEEFLVTRHNDDGTSDVLAVDSATGTERVLIDDQPVSNPNISEDRRWIVYLEGPDGAPQRPMIAHADGTSRRPLMPTTAECVGTGRPAWSSDGGRLAVVCLDARSHSTGLHVVALDGQVGPDLAAGSRVRASATWTGHDTLVYGRFDGSNEPVSIMEVPADGSEDAREIVPAGGYFVSQLDWSEAGLLFVRSRTPGAAGDVWLLDPDGGLTQFTNDDSVTSVSWSPDATSAVFTTGSDPTDPAQTLWVQGPDGEPHELTSGPFGPPSWGSR